MKEHTDNKNIENAAVTTERLARLSEKQTEVIRTKLDEAEKKHREHVDEQEVLHEAIDLAHNTEKHQNNHPAGSTERRRGAPSKRQLKDSFRSEMKSIQQDLSPGSKLVSKFIHIPVIEKVSDTLGSTIARPNALLWGSICAFITITALYLLARYFGYKLSGFETIAAFIVGWLLGTTYDYLSTAFRRRK